MINKIKKALILSKEYNIDCVLRPDESAYLLGYIEGLEDNSVEEELEPEMLKAFSDLHEKAIEEAWTDYEMLREMRDEADLRNSIRNGTL